MAYKYTIDVQDKADSVYFRVCYKRTSQTDWTCENVPALPITLEFDTNDYQFTVRKIVNHDPLIFGGDTFITRFALKRKHTFFLQDGFDIPDGTDIDFKDLGNVGYPNYWYDTTSSVDDAGSLSAWDVVKSIVALAIPVVGLLGLIGGSSKMKTLFKILLGVSLNRFDCDKTNIIEQKGKIYLHSTGIPYFLVESDVNTDLRQSTDSESGDFYPHTTDLSWWLQEKNVPFRKDNEYHYDRSYSKQNHESYIQGQAATYDPGKLCRAEFPQRLIYSDQFYAEDIKDNWLIFRANNYKDFPITSGRLVGVDGLEDSKVLVRLENTSLLFNAFVTLQTSGDDVQVSNGGMFQQKPVEFFRSDLGYLGTQHTAFLSTEYGHVSTDAERGSIYLFSTSSKAPQDLAQNGMKNWFRNNLPFQIKKDFPELTPYDIDNNFKGIGIALAFDKRFDRLFVTKLDYGVIDSTKVKYDAVEKCFYVDLEAGKRKKIALTDKRYFCNRSWTASFNFLTKSWVSFHSFTPNFYIDHLTYFQSGINNNSYYPGASSVWGHNRTNKSYQVYYGIKYPFSVTSVKPFSAGQSSLNYIKYSADVFRYHNDTDKAHVLNVGFNKAIIHNDYQNTGVRRLITNSVDDLSQDYPNLTPDGIEILQTKIKGNWQFNDVWDVTTGSANTPHMITGCSGASEYVNLASVNYLDPGNMKRRIQGDYCKVTLINDAVSNYKFILKYVLSGSTKIG